MTAPAKIVSAFDVEKARADFPILSRQVYGKRLAYLDSGASAQKPRAVLEALFGVQTSFARTPKYNIGERQVNLENKKYRRRSGWLPYAEIACGCYFAGMIVFAIETLNFFAVPFLLLFVGGYFWAGFGTLFQEHQTRLQWLKQRRLEVARQI